MDILLVDDNPLMQQLMARFLGDLGYNIAIAGSAAEALDLARREPPALFVIDLRLPDRNGSETLMALRTLPGCATTPAIAMSGLSESEAQRFLSPDFAIFLSKPVDLDVLESTIGQYFHPKMTRSIG